MLDKRGFLFFDTVFMTMRCIPQQGIRDRPQEPFPYRLFPLTDRKDTTLSREKFPLKRKQNRFYTSNNTREFLRRTNRYAFQGRQKRPLYSRLRILRPDK